MYLQSTCVRQIAHNEEVNAGGWALKSPKTLAFTVYYVQFWRVGLSVYNLFEQKKY